MLSASCQLNISLLHVVGFLDIVTRPTVRRYRRKKVVKKRVTRHVKNQGKDQNVRPVNKIKTKNSRRKPNNDDKPFRGPSVPANLPSKYGQKLCEKNKGIYGLK